MAATKRGCGFFIVLWLGTVALEFRPMNINQRHLSSTQYFRQIYPKKNVVLHHTVSSNAMSPLRWWTMQRERIGTAYIVGKDGNILEAFDPRYWAHHLGIRNPRNLDLNQRSVGIEIVNEGFLWQKPDGPHWLHANGPIYTGETIEAEWRGGKVWPLYTPEQVEATTDLVKWLLRRFNLPATFAPFGDFDLTIPDKYAVYCHHNVRIDKTDTHPGFPYEAFKSKFNGKPDNTTT